MSGKDLHDIAESDSPEGVAIPPGWQGLVSWGVIRFGVGILFAGVFGLMLKEVYRDMRADRAELFQAYIKTAEAFSQNVVAINNMTSELRLQNRNQEVQTEVMKQQTEAIKELLNKREK